MEPVTAFWSPFAVFSILTLLLGMMPGKLGGAITSLSFFMGFTLMPMQVNRAHHAAEAERAAVRAQIEAENQAREAEEAREAVPAPADAGKAE